jgi:nitrogen-specific signal transduction histidine kinase
VGLLLGGGYGAWARYRDHRRLQTLQEHTTAALNTPLLLCRTDDVRGTPLNAPARRWLHQAKTSSEDAVPDDRSSGTERLPDPHPESDGTSADLPSPLVSWIQSLDEGAGQVHETEFPKNGTRPSTRVYARSMSIPSLAGADETCWLLRVIPPDLQTDLDSRRTWRLMAQRVAHDLRNPLTSIRLALQSMQMDYREADPEITATLDAYVDQIEDQIESLRRTATNVMKLVGAEEQNVLETDLSSFLRRKGRQLAANLPDDVELREELAEDLPPVSVDREQMTSVLENLVYNAVEALPEGGTVTIQAQLARNLSFSTSEMPRDYVLVEVMDTGVGMDAATRARAFDPGFTTAGEGTGLGLAMVKQIVEAHDGQVELESEPDVGTDVRVYLPVARGA